MDLQTLSPTADHPLHFKAFIHQLVQKFKPLQICNISNNNHNEHINDQFKEKNVTLYCDCCLLSVNQSNTNIDHEVQNFATKNYNHGRIIILSHGKETIEENTIANHCFYITVCSTPKLICNDNGNHFTPIEAAIKASEHFNHRMTLADAFLTEAHQCISTEQPKLCAFMLYQAAEQSCIALLRIYLGSRSEIRSLLYLLRLCCCFSRAPLEMFLSGSPDDQRIFEILLKSYSTVCYKDNFKISKDDSCLLYNKVTAFVTLAKVMCEEFIAQLTQRPIRHREFVKPAVRPVRNQF